MTSNVATLSAAELLLEAEALEAKLAMVKVTH